MKVLKDFYRKRFRFAEDIKLMTGKRPWIGWMVCWKYISPFLLFLVLIGVLYTSSSETAKYSAFVGCLQVMWAVVFITGIRFIVMSSRLKSVNLRIQSTYDS